MSNENNFIKRWSRRKQEAAASKGEQPEPLDGLASQNNDFCSAQDSARSFDLASLPTIESIGPGSDIRDFLAAGVPADVKRAALRQIWSSDPGIRDFVGLSENSWDFNAADAMPGFGPVDQDQVGRLLETLRGEAPSRTVVEAHSSSVAQLAEKSVKGEDKSDRAAETQITAKSAVCALTSERRQFDIPITSSDVTHSPEASIVAQRPVSVSQRPLRRHGSAVPK
jgi:hypothetical protein